MNYQSSQLPHPTQRGLDPYALVHRWGWWYVIGLCNVHREIRTFRVDRIFEISMLAATFSISTDFDLRSYLQNELQSQPQIKVKLQFQADAVNLVTANRSYWESIETQADGSMIVILSAPTLEWAASTTLAYGPVVEALEPPELRIMVAEWIAMAAQKYTTEKGKHL